MKDWLIVIGGMLGIGVPCVAIMFWTGTHPGVVGIVMSVLFIGWLIFAVLWMFLKRAKDMREIADRHGFTFLKKGDATTLPQIGDLPIMHRGDAYRGTLCLMQGEVDGHGVALFDYSVGYNQSGGNSMKIQRMTVAAVQVDNLDLPAFEMRPKKLLANKPSPSFERVELDGQCSLEGFIVASREPGAFLNNLRPQVCDFFAERKQLSAEGMGNWVVIYREKKLIPKDKVDGFLDDAVTLAKMMSRDDS